MITLFGKPEATLAERLKASVSKTKAALSETVDTIFLGEKKVDPALLKQLENALLAADLGVGTTREILDSVREKLDRNALSDAGQLKAEIKSHIARILNASNGCKGAGVVAGSPNGKGRASSSSSGSTAPERPPASGSWRTGCAKRARA